MNTSHFKMVCRHVTMTEDYIVKNDTNILFRYEHPGHSKTEARKPTAREQRRAKSMPPDPYPGKSHMSKKRLHGLTNLLGVQLARRRCKHLQARRPCSTEARHYRGEKHSRRPLGIHRRRNVRVHDKTSLEIGTNADFLDDAASVSRSASRTSQIRARARKWRQVAGTGKASILVAWRLTFASDYANTGCDAAAATAAAATKC
jgi:hypothetical protein